LKHNHQNHFKKKQKSQLVYH